jgi:indole-3-glycerol phosphate synthase
VNLLRELVEGARETIQSGYYRPSDGLKDAPSLVRAIHEAQADGRRAVIAEATPTRGKLVEGGLEGYMARFVDEGACGLSVLTEPKHFHGSLALMKKAIGTRKPVLMKDFIIAEEQIDCAAHYGASAILLIASILPKKRIQILTEYAHLASREVLLEVGNEKEYEAAMASDADLVGINNRDLRSFEVDIERTIRIAASHEKEKPLVSLSGFTGPEDAARVDDVADAILVGSSLLEGVTTVQELTQR